MLTVTNMDVSISLELKIREYSRLKLLSRPVLQVGIRWNKVVFSHNEWLGALSFVGERWGGWPFRWTVRYEMHSTVTVRDGMRAFQADSEKLGRTIQVRSEKWGKRNSRLTARLEGEGATLMLHWEIAWESVRQWQIKVLQAESEKWVGHFWSWYLEMEAPQTGIKSQGGVTPSWQWERLECSLLTNSMNYVCAADPDSEIWGHFYLI